jgi:dethiobiotin synthetase
MSAARQRGLFVVGTTVGVGATVAAAVIAHACRRAGAKVAVFQPIATGCVRRREGLVSEVAEFLAVCADTAHPLDLIAPVRYADATTPQIAARRADRPIDWQAIERSTHLMTRGTEVLIVRAPAGGVLTPLDDARTTLDLARMFALPVVIVAAAGVDAISQIALTASVLRAGASPIGAAGVVVNRYPAESASVADEESLRQIERWAGAPVLCVLPAEPFSAPELPAGIVAAAATVDWIAQAGRPRHRP